MNLKNIPLYSFKISKVSTNKCNYKNNYKTKTNIYQN